MTLTEQERLNRDKEEDALRDQMFNKHRAYMKSLRMAKSYSAIQLSFPKLIKMLEKKPVLQVLKRGVYVEIVTINPQNASEIIILSALGRMWKMNQKGWEQRRAHYYSCINKEI